jgi:hypothetical protein
MMKISRVAVLVTALLLVIATPALATQPDHEVPIKGTVVGAHWIDEAAPGCDADALWRFESSGTGQMSHLGRVDYFLTQCSFFDLEQGFTFGNGTITFTAANDDTLVIAQTGNSELIGDFAGFTVNGTWEAVGGTGRFANATGSGSMDGIGDIPGGDALFNLPDGAAMFNFVGEIAYDASDRSE